MANQDTPQHTYPPNLPAHFIGEFTNDAGEVVYVCDWTYHGSPLQSIGYEVSRNADGHVVGTYSTSGAIELDGHAESDTMTVEAMVAHIIALAKQRIDAAPSA
jgi:hypothetical protein